MKKIILAFDSFKGCISATDACETAANAIRLILPNIETIEIPLSDGGEGLVNSIQWMLPSNTRNVIVHGPLIGKVEASYAVSLDGKTAYMEMAAASGLTLVPQHLRNPMASTTYGVGEMIVDAINHGCKKIVMGIGGSATCDGGIGMIKAIADNNCLHTNCEFIIACDVANPLYGPNGAAYVFAPQKGASPEQVILLDKQLQNFARKTEQAGLATAELANYPGAGAAGGLGYAFLAYLKADLRSGIDIMLDIAEFDKTIKDADLVITGEGKSDEQTMMGKVPFGVLKRCKNAKVPVWLISGAIDDQSNKLKQQYNLVKSINENDHRPISELLKPEIAKENLEKKIQSLLNDK